MKPINQRIVSNIDGDCFDACMVSILELPDFPKWDRKTSQYVLWNEWLEKYNLQVIYYDWRTSLIPFGFHILTVKSAVYEGAYHAVVFKGDGWVGEIAHNPNPQDPRGVNIPRTDWIGFTIIAAIDPSKMITQP